ncbi:MAG: alpha-L-fucosidase [Limisphaerales bacterium]
MRRRTQSPPRFVSLAFLAAVVGVVGVVAGGSIPRTTAAEPPQAHGPIPTARQLRWHAMEFYGFLHFSVNTFTDKEWGYGDESPAIFNPTDFDADQIVQVARDAGMRGLILTAKHHDGFCLWPSKFTEHSVRNSPWKDGRGDVVREIGEACRRRGLRFGVYLSPWDRNHRDYGRPEYLAYYRNQLRELLTGYGELFTVWFDGANGGDGFYGGARETRRIDNRTFYDWPNTWSIVRELQPMACMFSDAGPDFRWVGNERGIAGDPCWATLDLTRPGRYPGGSSDGLTSGERPGTAWVPAECDVSIRPGWFYHEREDSKVKTPDQLLDIYYRSVGRGACLNLNLPPDRRGRIHDNDIAALREFRRRLDATFATDFAAGAGATASETRGGFHMFSANNLIDGDRASYWTLDDDSAAASDDGPGAPAEVILELQQPSTFDVIGVREHLPLGQRVEAFAIDQWSEGQWVECAQGTSIGNRRLLRLPAPVTTDRVRLRVIRASAVPALSEFSLHLGSP